MAKIIRVVTFLSVAFSLFRVEGVALASRNSRPARVQKTVPLRASLSKKPAAWRRVVKRISPLGRTKSGSILGRKSDSGVFVSRLSLKFPGYLKGHKLFGGVIVPAAAYVDSLALAVADATENGKVFLKQVSVSQPLWLEPGQIETVTTSAEIPTGRVDLSSSAAEKPHSRAKIGVLSEFPQGSFQPPGLPSTWRGKKVSRFALYRYFKKKFGLTYSGPFRSLRKIKVDGETATAVLPISSRLNMEEHAFHPALLDSAFHLVAAIRFLQGGDAMTAIPVRFPKVWVDTGVKLKKGDVVVAKLAITDMGVEQKGSKLKFDLWIGTSAGTPLVMMKDATLSRVTAEDLKRN